MRSTYILKGQFQLGLVWNVLKGSQSLSLIFLCLLITYYSSI